jgi:hypothetical protein
LIFALEGISELEKTSKVAVEEFAFTGLDIVLHCEEIVDSIIFRDLADSEPKH